jgi:protein required for attachment to host cells
MTCPTTRLRKLDMARITLDDLKPLLDQFGGDGQVVSCYADLRGADGFRHVWRGGFDTQAEALRKATGHGKPVRSELERNLADAQAILESAPHGAQWLAAFTAHQRGFLKTFALDVPVRTEVVAHPAPYLVPLLAAIHRRREYVVVHSDTHRGRIYTATPGSLQLVDEIDEDVPQKQHSSGERWGQAQATIARHRESAIAHFQKDLASRIEKIWDSGTYSGLILLGAHPVLQQLRPHLPERLAASSTREVPESWYERSSEVESTIRGAVLEAFRQDEVNVIAGFWDRLSEHRAVAAGPSEVVAAIQSGRIGPDGNGFLVLGPDPRETVGRCTRCRNLAVDSPTTCPRCQAPCVESNLWEEVLLTALRHRLAVHFVDAPDRLAAHGGMGAALPKGQ